MRDRVQDRGPGHLGAPRGLGLGGPLGDPLALDRDVDQAPERLGHPLDLGSRSQVTSLVRYSHARAFARRSGTMSSPSRGDGTGSSATRARAGAGRVARPGRRCSRAAPARLCPARIAEADLGQQLRPRARARRRSGRGSRPRRRAGGRRRPAARRRPPRSAARSARPGPGEWAIARLVAGRDEEEVERQHAQHRGHERGQLARAGSRSPAPRAGRARPSPAARRRRTASAATTAGRDADGEHDLERGGRRDFASRGRRLVAAWPARVNHGTERATPRPAAALLTLASGGRLDDHPAGPLAQHGLERPAEAGAVRAASASRSPRRASLVASSTIRRPV